MVDHSGQCHRQPTQSRRKSLSYEVNANLTLLSSGLTMESDKVKL